MKKKFNLDELPEIIRFALMAQMQVVIKLKTEGFDKEKFVQWCEGVWDSVMMNDLEKLNETLLSHMQKDLSNYVKKIKEDL